MTFKGKKNLVALTLLLGPPEIIRVRRTDGQVAQIIIIVCAPRGKHSIQHTNGKLHHLILIRVHIRLLVPATQDGLCQLIRYFGNLTCPCSFHIQPADSNINTAVN